MSVAYMNHKLLSYEQLFDDFIPYVSILDAIANIGENAKFLLASEGVVWRDFINNRTDL